MRRILSAKLLCLILLPIFIGFFPSQARAALLDSFDSLRLQTQTLTELIRSNPSPENIHNLEELDNQTMSLLRDVAERLREFSNPGQQSQMQSLLDDYTTQRQQWRELLPFVIESCQGSGGILSPIANTQCIYYQRQLQNLAEEGVASQNEIQNLSQDIINSTFPLQLTPEQEQNLQEVLDFYQRRERDVNATTQSLEDYKQQYSTCSSWINFSLGGCLRDLAGWTFDILTGLGTFVLFFAQNLFNYIIEVSIVDFKSLIDPSTQSSNIQNGGLAVQTLWRIFRDLANLTFIFMLLYIAGATILQVTNIDTKKTLTWLIVVALLVNFSAVFTRIAIDASNVMALVFYDRFKPTEGGKPNIAGEFIQSSRLADLFGTPAPQNQSDTILGKVAKGLGTLILTLVMSWVLIMSAGFFLVRMIVFILLIIVSPLAFAGYAIPWLKGQVTDKWNKELKKQVVFAPVFMALLYMVVTLSKGVRDIKFVGTGSSNALGYVIIYAMLIGLMLSALKIARDSADGIASSKLKSFGLGGLNAGGALTGWGLSHTVGRGAQKYLDSGRKIPYLGGLDRKLTNQLATRTWNPMNAVKAADKKIEDLKNGKGPGFNNRSFVQRQKDSKEKAKNKVDLHKSAIKGLADEKRGGTTAAAAKYISDIKNKDERAALYESLSPAERAKYEVAAEGAVKDTFVELRQGLKEEDRVQTGKAYGNRINSEESKKPLSDLLYLSGIRQTKDSTGKRVDDPERVRNSEDNVPPQDLVKNTSGNSLENLAYSDADWLASILRNDDLTKHFNNEHMQSLYNARYIIGNELWERVQTNVRDHGTHNKGKEWVNKKGNIPKVALDDRASRQDNQPRESQGPATQPNPDRKSAADIIRSINAFYTNPTVYTSTLDQSIRNLPNNELEEVISHVMQAPNQADLNDLQKTALKKARNEVIKRMTFSQSDYIQNTPNLNDQQKRLIKQIYEREMGNTPFENL